MVATTKCGLIGKVCQLLMFKQFDYVVVDDVVVT